MHSSADSRIWEAVSLDCESVRGLTHGGKRFAICLQRWLSARASGLRQLEFCDCCSWLGATTHGEVGHAPSSEHCRAAGDVGDC